MTNRFLAGVFSILIIASVLLSNIAVAQNNSFYSGDKPVYFIETCQTNLILTNGESSYIEYYIKGVGNVSNAFMSISLPSSVVKDEAKLEQVTNIHCLVKPGTTTWVLDDFSLLNSSVRYGVLVKIDTFFFDRTPDTATNWGALGYQQKDGTYHAPLRITFDIADNAIGGDYPVYATLLYTDGKSWYRETLESNIHVMAWYEDELIERIVLLASIIAIISGLLSIIINMHGLYTRTKNRENISSTKSNNIGRYKRKGKSK